MEKNIKGSQLIDSWLKVKKIGVKASTYSHYIAMIEKHIIPFFGDMTILEIAKKDTVADFILEKNAQLGKKSLQDLCIILKCIFKFAYEKGYVKAPIYINIPHVIRSEITIFSLEEQKKLEQYLLYHMDSISLAILFSLYSGIRIGELCALTYDDIDIDSGIVSISKTLQRIKNTNKSGPKTVIHVDSPKTVQSIRQIPIINFLKPYFVKFKCPNGYYLLSSSKKPIEPRTLQYTFTRILKELRLPLYNFHVLRHPYVKATTKIYLHSKGLEVVNHLKAL